MRAADLRDMPDAGLLDHIVTAKRDLFGLRMQAATGELDNTARLRQRQARARAGADRRTPARRRPQREG